MGVKDNSHFSYAREDIGWFCLLGITGGALGAAYNEVVKRVNHLRGGFLKGKPANRVALLKLIEAVTLALVCHTVRTLALLLALALALPRTLSIACAYAYAPPSLQVCFTTYYALP